MAYRLPLLAMSAALLFACGDGGDGPANNGVGASGSDVMLEGDCEGFVADPELEGTGRSCLYEQGGVSVCLHYTDREEADAREACMNVAADGETCFASALCDRGDATTMCWDEVEGDVYLYGSTDIEQLCTGEGQELTERPEDGWRADEYVSYVVQCDTQEGVSCECIWERHVPDGEPNPWDPASFSCNEAFLCCMRGGEFPDEVCKCSNDQTECDGLADDGFVESLFCPPGVT